MQKALEARDRSTPELTWLTSTQAGKLLNVHPKTVLNMNKRGELHGKRVGSTWRFHRDEILALLEDAA